MDRLANFLLYGGETKEMFSSIHAELVENNRAAVLAFAIIAAVGMGIMSIISFFDPLVEMNRTTYLACTLFFLALSALVWYAKRKGHDATNTAIVFACVYVFIALVYAFGINLGTFIEPNQPSVSFPVLLFAAPLLFTDAPIRMGATSVLGILAYTAAAYFTQDYSMLQYNLTSIVPYGLISIVISGYMMRIKIHRLALEHQNNYLIETDQLTGMLNRRSFEKHLQILRDRDSAAGTRICALDVNGLKAINDSIGHHAGDELIRGAADSIQSVLGPYGRCYRTGGDEFMAILEGVAPKPDELRDALDLRCSQFRGTFVSGLSISGGMAEVAEDESIDEAVRRADAAMYRNKTRYYLTAGIDRRRRA